jgi:hypothetical protein
LVRGESSSSVIDISGDGSHTRTGRNISLTSSTPKKTVQSVSSHYQNLPPTGFLGGVEEYNRTEAMVGFDTRKRRKVYDESERRNSFRVEMESGPRQRRTSLISEPSILVTKGTPAASVNGMGKNPILIDDLELDEVVEVSQAPKASQGQARKATPRPEANEVTETAETSQYISKPDRRGTAHTGTPETAVSSASSVSTAEALERVEGGSPGDAVDEVNFLEEDSVDLVKSSGGPVRVDQKAGNGARVKNNVMKPSTTPKSESISEEGDIPQSTFAGVRSTNKQGHTSRMLKSELSFEITYMQSGHKNFEVKDGCVPRKLQYDHDKKEFDIIENGESLHELYPSLVLKPEKIHIVKYHHHSLEVVLSRAMEASTGSAAQVLLKMSTLGDGDRFAQSLIKLNHTIHLSRLGRSASYFPNTFPFTDI